MTMRRFGSRWRDATTPVEVLDIFMIEGRYEILFRNWNTTDRHDEWADGLDIDLQGYRYAGFELQPHQASAYRYRNSKRRQTWASLPEPIRATVVAWLKED